MSPGEPAQPRNIQGCQVGPALLRDLIKTEMSPSRGHAAANVSIRKSVCPARVSASVFLLSQVKVIFPVIFPGKITENVAQTDEKVQDKLYIVLIRIRSD